MTTHIIRQSSKDEVLELAKAVEAIKIEYENWGLMNTPREVEKQVEARARGAIIRSRLATAKQEYEAAFADWERAGFEETFTRGFVSPRP